MLPFPAVVLGLVPLEAASEVLAFLGLAEKLKNVTYKVTNRLEVLMSQQICNRIKFSSFNYCKALKTMTPLKNTGNI
jgi:hypothetical protein